MPRPTAPAPRSRSRSPGFGYNVIKRAAGTAGGIAAAVPAALFVALAGTALHRPGSGRWPASDVPWGAVAALVLLGSVQLWLGAAFRSVVPTAACGVLCYALTGWWSTLETGKRLVIGDTRRESLDLRHRRQSPLAMLAWCRRYRRPPGPRAADAPDGTCPSVVHSGMPVEPCPGHAPVCCIPGRGTCPFFARSSGHNGIMSSAGSPGGTCPFFAVADGHGGTMSIAQAPALDMSGADRRTCPSLRGRRRQGACGCAHSGDPALSGRSLRRHHGRMVNIIEVLSNYDGVARAKHLAAAGVSDFQLKSALATGAVSRVARGVYALPGADAQLIAIRSLAGRAGVRHRGPLQRALGPRSPRPAARCPHPQPELPGLRLPPGARAADTPGHGRPKPALPARTRRAVIAESAVVLKGLPLAALRSGSIGRNDARERRIVAASSRSRSPSLSAWPGSFCGGPASTSNHRSTSREWAIWT